MAFQLRIPQRKPWQAMADNVAAASAVVAQRDKVHSAVGDTRPVVEVVVGMVVVDTGCSHCGRHALQAVCGLHAWEAGCVATNLMRLFPFSLGAPCWRRHCTECQKSKGRLLRAWWPPYLMGCAASMLQ